jgi:hypothetical protein
MSEEEEAPERSTVPKRTGVLVGTGIIASVTGCATASSGFADDFNMERSMLGLGLVAVGIGLCLVAGLIALVRRIDSRNPRSPAALNRGRVMCRACEAATPSKWGHCGFCQTPLTGDEEQAP